MLEYIDADSWWKGVLNGTAATIIITVFTLCLTSFIFQPAMSQEGGSLRNDKELVAEEDLNFIGQSDGLNDRCEDIKENENKPMHLLSLVIPAYNEEDRLPPSLISTINHLQSSKKEITRLCLDILLVNSSNDTTFESPKKEILNPFEIIIVNDGSNDGTVTNVKEVLKHNKLSSLAEADSVSIRLLTLTKNCGKGAAVRTGMLHTQGHLCLMLDADNATNFQPSLLKLLNEMKRMKYSDTNQTDLIVFGSRAHLQEDSKAKRSFVRTMLMVAFHFFVKTLCSNLIHGM